MEGTHATWRVGGRLVVVALLIGWTVTACSTEEALPPRDGGVTESADRRRVGSVLVEFDRPKEGGDWETRIQAQFLDARGVGAGRALRVLDVWDTASELEPDSCSMRNGNAQKMASEQSFRLDLLSVGTIGVQGPERLLRLEARRLPDVVSSFSGVVYGAGTGQSEALTYRPGARYEFEADGDGSTGGFEAGLEAPEPIEIRPRSGERLRGRAEVVLERGQPLRFRWKRRPGAEGTVYFDISTGHEPGKPQLKCRLEDDGRFSVPAGLVETLADRADEMRVSLRRAVSTPVGIAGLQRSRLILSTVDRLTLRIRSNDADPEE